MMDAVILVAVSGMEVTTLYNYKASSYDEKLRMLFAVAAHVLSSRDCGLH